MFKAMFGLGLLGILALGDGRPAVAGESAVPAVITLTQPRDFQVVQRTAAAGGRVVIAGSLSSLPGALLSARIVGTNEAGAFMGPWEPLAMDPRVAAFRGGIACPAGGWYRLEVRAARGETVVAEGRVEHLGMGEVFVVAGQSNSANYGEERQETATGLVAAWDGTNWRLAKDPQPGAEGGGGSFLPPLGDRLAKELGVPVGFVSLGVGATSVREWLPTGMAFDRPPTLTRNVVTVGTSEWEASGRIFEHFSGRLKALGTHGFRAVLWHQGESDAHQADPTRTLPGEAYRRLLEELIRATRREIGWEAPWFVAQVSYHIPTDTGDSAIHAAQQAVAADGMALAGPDTDTLTGERRENHGQGVHLSALGLREHGALWAEKVLPWLRTQLASPTPAGKAGPGR